MHNIVEYGIYKTFAYAIDRHGEDFYFVEIADISEDPLYKSFDPDKKTHKNKLTSFLRHSSQKSVEHASSVEECHYIIENIKKIRKERREMEIQYLLESLERTKSRLRELGYDGEM